MIYLPNYYKHIFLIARYLQVYKTKIAKKNNIQISSTIDRQLLLKFLHFYRNIK